MNKNVFIIVVTAVVSLFSIWHAFQLLLSNYESKPIPLPSSASSVTSEPLSPAISPTPQPIQLIFTGDGMFDRHIRMHGRTQGYDFLLENLTPVLTHSDVVIMNLEGPITDNPSRSEGSAVGSTDNYFFTFDPLISQTLVKNNIKVVNLGNNHILNFGQDGLSQTVQNLEAYQIAYFGNTGTNLVPDFLIQTIRGYRIAFINHNQFVPNGYETTLQTLITLPEPADLVVVYAHWGNEYETIANTVIQNQAHDFVDAGADLVIGSHPHVVQQSEVYNNATIYYSLGNFVFDQYFSPEVQQGLLVKVEINPETSEMSFTELPIQMTKDGKTSLRYNESL